MIMLKLPVYLSALLLTWLYDLRALVGWLFGVCVSKSFSPSVLFLASWFGGETHLTTECSLKVLVPNLFNQQVKTNMKI